MIFFLVFIIAFILINPEDILKRGHGPDNEFSKPINLSLEVNADSTVLMDYGSGEILHSKNANKEFPPASMSKLMVEYLILRAIEGNQLSWESPVTISQYAFQISSHPGFSSVPLEKGHTYTVRELYAAMAIHSANGATIALAEKAAGSEKQFVQMMNETAKEMGLKHTTFVNSTGLSNRDLGGFYHTGRPSDHNMMSAKDIAVLARKLIQEYPAVLRVTEKAVEVFNSNGESEPYKYYSTNLMLPGRMKNFTYPGVDGLKTGYTKEAGYCFTGTVERSGQRLITVVMGTSSKKARFNETEKLFNYGFSILQ